MSKKWFLFLSACIALCFLSPCSVTGAEEDDSGKDGTFIFPSSLMIIEDEAFEGTAVETVFFPDGLSSIGSGAFENVYTLKDVYIPDTVTYIADSAFSITSGLTFHGIDDSYAEEWANKHEIPFAVDDVWNVIIPIVRPHAIRTGAITPRISAIALLILCQFYMLSYYEVRSRRPQDRTDLPPIDYRFP